MKNKKEVQALVTAQHAEFRRQANEIYARARRDIDAISDKAEREAQALAARHGYKINSPTQLSIRINPNRGQTRAFAFGGMISISKR